MYQNEAKNGRALVAVAGLVHNVSDFLKYYPGEKALVSFGIGKDATATFNSGAQNHYSNAASDHLSTKQVP